MGNPIFDEEYDRNQCFLPPPLDNDSMSLKHYFNPCKEDDNNIQVFHQQLDMSTMMSLDYFAFEKPAMV